MDDEIRRLAEVEGGYQPVIVAGKRIVEGWRECDARYEIIRPHLDHNQTVVDIGSHYGYFSYSIARDFESFVWSIEAGSRRADIQRRMLEANGPGNVVLTQAKWSRAAATPLMNSCFMADVILMLSVAHYFPPEELPDIIEQLSHLAPTLIMEFPSLDEREVASKANVHATDMLALLHVHYEKVELIGTGRSPKHEEVTRPIYKASNTRVIRQDVRSNVGSTGPKRHTVEYEFGQWHLDGQPRNFTGLTLEDLRGFGMVYPDVRRTLFKAADYYEHLIHRLKGAVTDINIRNVLMTDKGLVIIDFTEGVGHRIYDMDWAAYTKRTLSRDRLFHFREFEQMWEGTWKP